MRLTGFHLWPGMEESEMLTRLHNMGLKSEHCYLAGMVSIGVAVATWLASQRLEHAGLARADRWGIFVGEWAPTFFAMGNGLRTYEK
jgi:hypothetical protein